MKILAVRWIGGRTTIGIVCIENEMGKRSARIANIDMPTLEEADKQYVAEWGAALTFEESQAFFPKFITEENFKFK